MFERLAFRGFYRGLRRILFVSMFFIFGEIFAAGAYTVTYNCGSNGTAPASVTQSSGTTITLANGCTGVMTGDYDFNGWYCISNNDLQGAAYNGGDHYTLYDDVTCYAIWTLVNPCDPGSVLSEEILGTYDDSFGSWEAYVDTPEIGIWEFDYGTVSLRGRCSSTQGQYGVPDNPVVSSNANENTYCWCRADSFTPAGGEEPIPLSNNPWIYSGFYASNGCTDSQCQTWCWAESSVFWTSDSWREYFLRALYTTYICEYTLTYNCANGNDNQSALSGGTYQGGQLMGLWSDGGNCDAPTGQTFDYWTCDNGVSVSQNNTVTTPYNNMICTAHWVNLPYSITYNCNNGNNAQSSVNGGTAYMGNTVPLPEALGNNNTGLGYVNVCDQSNTHSFLLWECYDENGNSVNVSFTNVEETMQQINNMPASNVECIAQWSQQRDPVFYTCGQFNNNGTAHDTSFLPITSTNNFDVSTVYPSLCTPDTGYTFDHWNCYQGGNGAIINMNTIVNSGTNIIHPHPYDTLCVAQWTPPTYALTYTCGSIGGSALSGSVVPAANSSSYTAGTTNISLTSANNVDTSGCSGTSGYTFNGWNCHQSGQSGTVNSGYTISTMPAYDVICDAQWTQICTITLNPSNGVTGYGGGDSSSSANNIKTIYSRYGDGAYKTNTNGVLSNKMTSQSGLADTPPSPALGIPVGRYVTITFDAQTPAPTNPVTGNQYSVTNPNNSVVQRGFAGYYSMQSSSGGPTQQYIDADGYITSYGQSAAENINPNNDSCPTWYARYTCPTIFLPYVNLDGYTLMRWRTSNGNISLSMNQYLQGRQEPLCVDADLNAIWRANTYTIQYVLNGGTHGTDHPESATYDIEFPVSNPTRNGYTFAGWTITGMDGVTHYYSANSITPNGVYQSSTTQTTTNTQLAGITDTHFMNLRSISGTVTFTAQWTENTVYLRWEDDNNPGQGDTPSANGSSQCNYGGVGSSFTVPSAPTKQGYSFNGWKVTNWECGLSMLNSNVGGIWHISRGGVDHCVYHEFNTGQEVQNCLDSRLSGLGSNEWEIEFEYGHITGIAKCSALSGDNNNWTWTNANSNWTAQENDLISAGDGSYCWCHATSYTSTNGGQQCNITQNLWVFKDYVYNNHPSVQNYTCISDCARNCAYSIGGFDYFRQAFFSVM